MTALLFLAVQGASRLGLVVAVDDYGFTSSRLPTDQRLAAAKNDAAAMNGMLGAAGFTTKTLLQSQATKAAVERELAALATSAQKGSDVFFYFSGRGSTSAEAPTLVPADGLEDKPTNDVAMARVEEMAKKAAAKGAHVTIVVDACFAPPGARGLEARIYKPITKCVRRKGGVRMELYAGPGVFLCPAQARGAAYEWRASGDPASWTSAFTDYLAGAGTEAVLLGKLPTVRSLMREADAYFKSRVNADYMPNTRVALPASATDPGYEAPFPTTGTLPDVKPELRVQAQRRIAALKDKERSLRVAVKVDRSITEDARRAALASRIIELKEPLESVEGVKLATPYDSRVDRVITVTDKGGFTLTVQGGDITKIERAAFTGASPAEAAVSGLDSYLERELLAKRLWNQVESNPGPFAWEPTLTNETIQPNERLELNWDGKQEGYLYILNRDNADGEVKLLFPHPYESEPFFSTGPQKAPKGIKNDPRYSTAGRSTLVAVYVPLRSGSLPPLAGYHRNDDVTEANRKFEASLVPNLRRLLETLSADGASYGSKRLEYRIP